MEEQAYITELLDKWISGTAGRQEQEALAALVDAAEDEELLAVLEMLCARVPADPSIPAAYWDTLYASLVDKTRLPAQTGNPAVATRSQGKVRRLRRFRAATAVAAALLLFTAGWWYARRQHGSALPLVQRAVSNDIPAPPSNRATIILAGGRQIDLDSASNGTLAIQGASRVVKLANGQVAYQATGAGSGALVNNTLTNPRGSRIISLTLSDGTRVWLNAESSLRYPAVFGDGERRVAVTGEVYFEVASDAGKPFRVTKGAAEVRVLGTRFDINAYGDDKNIQVTLLDGAVRVSAGAASALLRPREQATVAGEGRQPQTAHGISVSKNADVDAVMAWKNGLFHFHDADLPTVMSQLARWYDVRVVYAGSPPKMTFNGEIGRILTLDQVLRILTNSRVHYTIDNNRILTIRP